LLRKRLREESGYTLVEVMVSIIILAIAILPMAAMFDMGLSSATTSGNYDKARALANLKLEQAKSLPFDSDDNTIQDLKDDFPFEALASETPTAYDDGVFLSGPMDDPDEDYWDNFTGFEYEIEKRYMCPPDAASPSQNWSSDCPTPTDLIKVTVTVEWSEDKSYETFGLVAQ